MKILIAAILIFISLATVQAQGSTETLSPDLQEANKLSGEVVKLFGQKKYEEALPLAQKVVRIREKELGKNHLSVAQAWRNLGYIQQRREKIDDAADAFDKAFDIYEANQPLSGNDEKVFTELLEIVATYQANEGNYEKAEKKLQRSLELSEKIYGKYALEVSNPLLKLAQIYQLKLEYENALPLFLRALDIKYAKLGKSDDDTRFVFSNAQCALTKLDQKEKIEELTKKYYPPTPTNKFQIGYVPRTINSGIVNGKALSLPKPPYPAEARSKRAKGAVEVKVIIDETGKVIFACAQSGEKELYRASEYAAYNSKFAPTTLEGDPVRVTGIIVYNFVLGGR